MYKKIKIHLILYSFIYFIFVMASNVVDTVKINKCCEKFEIFQDQICVIATINNTEEYKPLFEKKDYDINYTFLIGNPVCGSNQIWRIYDYPGSADKLILLEGGLLRHYTTGDNEDNSRHHDYVQGQYCIDKGILSNGTSTEYTFAKVCSPHVSPKWSDYKYLYKIIMKPLFDIVSIIIYLIIAIIYFVLPTLRDLVGNIITTISLCLICNQAANLVKDLQLDNYINFLFLDSIIYTSLLGAFVWLNSLGYYIWKNFNAQNVYLRVTDGQKYCWYSSYTWGLTFVLSILAIFCHTYLDINIKYQNFENSSEGSQVSFGWLGIALFFSPMALTILIDLFFQLNTIKLLYKKNIYGRIQQKLRSNFIMYILLFSVMTINWIFLILSWFNINILLYTYIILKVTQAPVIFYICILQQKHVKFLLTKTFCRNEPPSSNDWGEELAHINNGNF